MAPEIRSHFDGADGTLKERKGGRMYINDNLTNEERKTQNKLRERQRKKGENRIKLNGEWFIWDEREEKLKKHF
jgi:hypothetical protein